MTKKHHHAHHTWLGRLSHQVKKRLGHKLETKTHLFSILKDAERKSLLNTDSLLMMESVLEFGDLKVRDIMIPRNQMVTVFY